MKNMHGKYKQSKTDSHKEEETLLKRNKLEKKVCGVLCFCWEAENPYFYNPKATKHNNKSGTSLGNQCMDIGYAYIFKLNGTFYSFSIEDLLVKVS